MRSGRQGVLSPSSRGHSKASTSGIAQAMCPAPMTFGTTSLSDDRVPLVAHSLPTRVEKRTRQAQRDKRHGRIDEQVRDQPTQQ